MIEKGRYTQKNISILNDALDSARRKWDVGDLRASNLHISGKNIKMGEIPSVSTLPVITCPGICAGTCAPNCYALKYTVFRPTVLKAYAENTVIYERDANGFFNELFEFLHKGKTDAFRFDVAGDAPDRYYAENVLITAQEFPEIDILKFTRAFALFNDVVEWECTEMGEDLPENMHLLFSGYDRKLPEKLNPYHFPETIVIKKGQTPGKDVKICPGHCDACKAKRIGCWRALPGDVIGFYEH